jgi:hypothetical protein
MGGPTGHAGPYDVQAPLAFTEEGMWITVNLTLNFAERTMNVQLVSPDGFTFEHTGMAMLDYSVPNTGNANAVPIPINPAVGSVFLMTGRQGGSNVTGSVSIANLAVYTAAAGAAAPPETAPPTTPPPAPPVTTPPTTGTDGVAPPTPPTTPPTHNQQTGDNTTFVIAGILGGLLLTAVGVTVVLKKRQTN